MVLTSRHFVIIVYAILMLGSILLLYSNIVAGNKKDECAKIYSWLYLFLPVRLIIKIIYFYIEYFVRTWPLDFAINFAMDASYVISILLCLAIVRKRTGQKNDWKFVLHVIAAVCYAFGFLIISYLWLGRETNVNIVFPGGIANVIYIANETFFIVVTLLNVIFGWIGSRKSEHKVESAVLLLNIVWYAIYVYCWNISFIVPIPIRNTKPLDGVLFFTAVIIVLYFLPLNRRTKAIANASVEAHTKSLAEIAKEHELTERETEIFEMLIKGSTYNEISEQIFISTNTVKKHCGSIYAKFDVKNRSQLSAEVSAALTADELVK